MKTLIKFSSIRFAPAIIGGLVLFAVSGQAQNTLTATATLSDVPVGSTFDYTLTLQNTGSVAINSLWYGWVPGVFNLPTAGSNLQNVQNSLAWNATDDGNSIEFENNSGTALAADSSMTITFDSTETPSSFITDSSSRPVASIAYAAANGPSTFGANQNGVSSAPIDTTLSTTPEPATTALLVFGSVSLFFIGRNKMRQPAVAVEAISRLK